MIKKDINSELSELLKASIFNFEAQIFVLGKLAKVDLDEKTNQIKSLLLSASSTGGVISFCGKQPYFFPSEGMMLARSFIEKIINFIYLIYCDDLEYERFHIHPYYRQFHNLKMNIEAGDLHIGLIYSGIDEFKKNPLVSKALEVFDEENSRLEWSKSNIYKKIKLINNSNIGNAAILLLSKLTIYSNASEALHGSLFGITNHLGVYDPTIDSKNQDEVFSNLLRNLILMFANLTFLSNEIFISLSKLDLLDKKSFQELYDISTGLCEPQINILKSMVAIK